MAKQKFEQTKGYAFLVGKIYGIDGKEPKVTGGKTTLTVRIKTNKENSIFVSVGGWDTNAMKCKLKAKGMDIAEEFLSAEVPDILREYFKDGDSVLIRGSINVNTYKEGRLEIIANGIYASTEEVNFESAEFEERNEITIPAIVSNVFKNSVLPVKFATYGGDELDMDLTVESDIIKDFLGSVEAGDLMPVTIETRNTPIYEEESGKDNKQRTTLMGRKMGGNNKKITGTDTKLVLIDVDVEKIEKNKYTIEKIDNDDLPF